MADQNIYQELQKVLKDFKDFLDQNIPTIQPAIRALRSLVPQIDVLLNRLIELMEKLKAEIQKLNVSTIPGLKEAAEFTQKTKAFLEAAKNLLPEEAATIDQVQGAADVVGGLPDLDAVKGDILNLIDGIVTDLNQLKS